jgi:hypothetical protein
MGASKDGKDGEMSLYRRFLLNKYPTMTFKNYQSLSQHLETLKRKSAPSAIPSYSSFISRVPPPDEPPHGMDLIG